MKIRIKKPTAEQKKSILSVSLTFSCVIILIMSISFSANVITELRNEIDIKDIYIGIYKAQMYNEENRGYSDPTYIEMLQFLCVDETDKHLYIEDEYVCSDFSTALVANASAFNMRVAYIRLVYTDHNAMHAIVAFNTTDKGLIYVEPQSDAIVDIFVGCTNQDRIVEKVYMIWRE